MCITLATFMEILDTSIANVALPHIAGGLSVTPDEATWVLTSYLVANAVVLPLSGWLASMIGRKRFYMSCVALFTISSFLCGLAPSLTVLIITRIMQGAGGGGLQPSEQAILADIFTPAQRGMAFAIYGMAVVLAPAIGPTLGGWITDNSSWRWIFYVNVPVGIISLLLSSRLVEDPPWAARGSRKGIKVDYMGIALIVLGIASLQFVLDKGQRDLWFESNTIVIFSIAAAACLLTFVIWEWRQKHPVLDLRLFANRSFAIAALMMFALGAVLMSSTVLLPLYLQTMLGYTAQQAGEALSVGGLVVICLLPLVGYLTKKVDLRFLVGIGFLATGLALFHMRTINLQIDFRTAVMYRVYQAIGLPFLFIPITSIAYTDVPLEKNNQVSATVNLMRNLGGSVGISLATLLLSRRIAFHEDRLSSYMRPENPIFEQAIGRLKLMFAAQGADATGATRSAYAVVSGELARQSAALSYIDVIQVLAIIAVCFIPLVFLAKRVRPGAAAMGH
jgi:DHA2 family multidrug resistance protein